MDNRYYIKQMVIAYEIPTDISATEKSCDEMSNALTAVYRDWFDVILCNIAPYELPNLNKLYMYQLVARVDTIAITKAEVDNQWEDIRKSIEMNIEKFLSTNGLIFQKLA